MVNIRQGHPFSKFGLILVSLACYAVMLLHPFIAHVIEGERAEQQVNSAISAIIEKSEILAKFVAAPLTSQIDCSICKHMAGNPTVLLSISSFSLSLLLLNRQNLDTLQQLGANTFLYWLSRAPPAGLECSNP